jgi:hypothetical protein
MEKASPKHEPASALPKAFFSITRFPNRTLLKVSGRIEDCDVDPFARALGQAFCFSGKPVVVDMREVEETHPRAVQLLIRHWTEASYRLVPAEVLLSFASRDLLDALREACPVPELGFGE